MVYYLFDSRTFRDQKIRRMSFEHRWLWAALLAGENRTRLPGLILLRLAALADETQLDAQTVWEGLQLFERNEMVVIDQDAELIQLPNAPRHNTCPNANVLRAWFGVWEELPHCALKYEHLRLLPQAVNMRTNSMQECWRDTFAKVLELWDAQDPSVRLVARHARTREVPGPAQRGAGGVRTSVHSEPKPFRNGFPSGRGSGSGKGSGSGRDGFETVPKPFANGLSTENHTNPSQVETREQPKPFANGFETVSHVESHQPHQNEAHGQPEHGGEGVGTGAASDAGGGPVAADGGGGRGRGSSRVAELARSRGLIPR